MTLFGIGEVAIASLPKATEKYRSVLLVADRNTCFVCGNE